MTLPDVFQKVCEKNQWPCDGRKAQIKLPGGRAQTVSLETFVHGEERMARVSTVIGTRETLSEARLEAALKLNFSLPHGAMALKDEKLVLVDTFLVRDADEGEVEASVRFLAGTADRYEKLIYRTDEN
jgi:hypothetical protein